MEPIHDGERAEFVPWDQLGPGSRISRPAGSQLAVLLVAVAGLVGGVFWLGTSRNTTSSDVSLVTAPILEVEPPTSAAVAAPVPTSVSYAEADLRSIAPAGNQDVIAALATEFLRDYLSTGRPDIHPYGGPTVSIYVEWVTLLEVEQSDGSDRWTVAMRAGLLELGDEPRRLPVGEYAVTVSLVDGVASVSLPTRRAGSGTDPAVVVDNHELVEVPATVADVLSLAPDDDIIGGWQDDQGWHMVVRDRTGLPLVVDGPHAGLND